MHPSASISRKFTGTIYELLSAPVSALEIVTGYVGAAATKSVVIGLIILATASLFVPLRILHPAVDGQFPAADRSSPSACSVSSSGSGPRGFEQLQFVPMLVLTPLTFLGGAFYSITMLPAAVACGHAV
jgi:ABC-2 type transport system permease protein